MVDVNQRNESTQKLKQLLRTLFQFDVAELDFGIYRIMNYKRREIESFIENDLIRAIEREFEKYKALNQQELLKKIERSREEIRKLEKNLGERILKNQRATFFFIVSMKKKVKESYFGMRVLEQRGTIAGLHPMHVTFVMMFLPSWPMFV